MKRTFRALAALLLVLTAVLCLGTSAFADSAAGSRPGSISVSMQVPGTDEVIKGGSFELFQVGMPFVGPEGSGFRLTPDFADSGVRLTDLEKPGICEHLLAHARSKDLKGTVDPVDPISNFASFRDLEAGLYLITQVGKVDGWKQSRPFLVPLPLTDANGDPDWSVVAHPKMEPVPPEPVTHPMSVRKLWVGGGPIPNSISVDLLRDGQVFETVTLNNANSWKYTWPALSDEYTWSLAEVAATPDYDVVYDWQESLLTMTITNTYAPHLDTTELSAVKVWDDGGNWDGKRPGQITVQLYRDGAPYQTVALSNENGWAWHWTGLPDNSVWTLRELDVPAPYKVEYRIEGTVISIVNHNPPPPPPPPLIPTGQLNWPVPTLALLGLIVFAAGWVLTHRNGGRKQDETNTR